MLFPSIFKLVNKLKVYISKCWGVGFFSVVPEYTELKSSNSFITTTFQVVRLIQLSLNFISVENGTEANSAPGMC